jgi:hypothetical protein
VPQAKSAAPAAAKATLRPMIPMISNHVIMLLHDRTVQIKSSTHASTTSHRTAIRHVVHTSARAGGAESARPAGAPPRSIGGRDHECGGDHRHAWCHLGVRYP